MKRVILVSMFFLIFTSFVHLNAQWAKTYGGGGDDEAWSIQQTSDGGYIVAGLTESFGAGQRGIWVLKLSSEGDIEWQRTYGGSNYDHARSIQQTNDGGYIVAGDSGSWGAGSHDIWILKLSSEGDIEWQKTYGGDDHDTALSIQQTSDGGYIVASETSSFGAGQRDIWVLKLSSEGDIEWQRAYGGSMYDSDPSIQQTSDGGYIVAGYNSSFSAGGDIWILKLSSNGDIEWQKTYGRSLQDGASSIQQTYDGGYIVAGDSGSWGGGSHDIWILKLSSEGDIEWQKTYGGDDSDAANPSIQQTYDGGYIVAGAIGRDIWILKLFSAGDVEWQKTYGGNYSSDAAHSIQQTNDGGYIVAGYTQSWGVRWEIWVFKLLPNGDINPRCAFIKNSNAEVSDTDITPEDTAITPGDTAITPEDTDISPQDSDANVYKLGVSSICTLTLSANRGGTTDPAPGTYTYATGTKVTLEAVPDDDCSFNYWLRNIDCDKNPITITMDGDKSIKANFYTPGPGGGEGIMSSLGICFIATAAYGSSVHPSVKTLRDFRDKYLMINKLGRMFIDFYYKYSPFVANLIAKHKALKVTVRISLLPLVALSYSLVHFGPIVTSSILVFIFVLPIFLISLRRKKLK